MRAYLDSSVVLRLVMREPGALRELGEAEAAIASALVRLECLRVIDRHRLAGRLPEEDVRSRQEDLRRLLDGIELVDLSPIVLERAAQPMPSPVGTLDAIHLATALLWRERSNGGLVMATHDAQLGRAARLFALDVIGLP